MQLIRHLTQWHHWFGAFFFLLFCVNSVALFEYLLVIVCFILMCTTMNTVSLQSNTVHSIEEELTSSSQMHSMYLEFVSIFVSFFNWMNPNNVNPIHSWLSQSQSQSLSLSLSSETQSWFIQMNGIMRLYVSMVLVVYW